MLPLCTCTGKCKTLEHNSQARIHTPERAVANTKEYRARQQHGHGLLDATSCDAAAPGNMKCKLVFPTLDPRVERRARQRRERRGASAVGLGSWSAFSRPSALIWYHERRAVAHVSQDPSPRPHAHAYKHSVSFLPYPPLCCEFLKKVNSRPSEIEKQPRPSTRGSGGETLPCFAIWCNNVGGGGNLWPVKRLNYEHTPRFIFSKALID